jgi:hypothetical protein
LEQSSKHEAEEQANHKDATKDLESRIAELESILKGKNEITDELRKEIEHKVCTIVYH